MKKYKLIIQLEQIKKYLEQGQLKEAYNLAVNVDTKKLKSMSDLSVIAECYFQNRRYVEAKELFEQIYDTVKTRRILAQLVHLSIKLKDIIEANYYLEEFIKMAPDDFYQYIFRYSIDKLMRKPTEVLIADLEKLREVEYIECWAYELAKLYYKTGNETACRKECEKIILWFGSGEYVDRAKALVAFYNGELDINMLLEATKQTNNKNSENNSEGLENQEKEIEAKEDLKDRCAEEITYQLNEKENVRKDSFFVDSDSKNDDTADNEDEGIEKVSDEEVAVFEENETEKEDYQVDSNDTIDEDDIKDRKFDVLQENIGQEDSTNENIDQETGMQEEKEKEEKVNSTIVIPPGFGKSKHTLFHKKYVLREDTIGIEGATNVKTDKDTMIVDNTNILESASDEHSYSELELNSKKDRNIDTELENGNLSAIKEGIEKDREELADNRENLEEDESKKLIEEGSKKLIEEGSKKLLEDDNESLKEDPKSFFHIDSKSNYELIDDLHSNLLPILEEKGISLCEMFGNFLRIDGLRENLLHSLEMMIHSAYGLQNIIIMGSANSGKTLLAKKYAKLLHRLSFITSPRVALIDAKKLNRMDFLAKSDQLKDCIMILQNAQFLTRDTLIRLMELQQIPEQNIIYILTGLSEEMEQLWKDKEELSITYPNRIVLPEYKLADYQGFAYDTIIEEGYKIEKEAFEYLSDKLLDKMKLKRENALSEVFSYLDQIILNHEKENEQVLLELTRNGSLNQFDLSILRKKDIL